MPKWPSGGGESFLVRISKAPWQSRLTQARSKFKQALKVSSNRFALAHVNLGVLQLHLESVRKLGYPVLDGVRASAMSTRAAAHRYRPLSLQTVFSFMRPTICEQAYADDRWE